MNLLGKRTGGWLLWLAPLLFACESDEILSLPQEPGDRTLSLRFSEIPLSFSLVQDDSVLTRRRSSESEYHLLVGNYRDDAFGQVQAQAFTEFTLASKPEITAEDQFDSLVLIVANDYFYGDAMSAASQTLGIYQLADTLARKAYYSQDRATVVPNPLAEYTFSPDPEVTSSADTLRIALDSAFGEELFGLAQANDASLATDSAFREYFRGIAISSIGGGNFITGFDPARMVMALYFSTSDETTSTSHTFDVDENRAVTFNNYSFDRSGTPLASVTTANQELMADDGRFYLQSGTGLAPTLSLQPVLDFIEAMEDSSATTRLRVNRIDLYIGTEPAEEGQPLPNALFAYGFEEDFTIKIDTVRDNFGRPSYPPRGLVADNTQSGSSVSPIQPDDSRFQARITSYVLGLLAGAPNRETRFIIRTDNAGDSFNQLIAEPDSVIAKVYYTLLQ